MVPNKQIDPLGILGDKAKKQADPLGILKKKEPSQVTLSTGGKAGTSEAPSGFGDLKPAKIQPVKVEVPKQLREEEVKLSLIHI